MAAMKTTTEAYISMARSDGSDFRREFEAAVKERTKQLGAEGAIALNSDLRVRTRVMANLHPRELKIDDNPIENPELISIKEMVFRYQTFYYFRSKGMRIPRKENEYYIISAPFYDNKHCRYGSYEDLLARGGEWAKWLVTYTNLTPRLFEIAKQNECASFQLAVNWEKLAEAQGSDIFTFNGLVRKMVKEERAQKDNNNKDNKDNKDKEVEE